MNSKYLEKEHFEESIIQMLEAAKAPGSMTTKIIAIDGQGGAGKSTLAESLSKILGGAPIIHTDDFASWAGCEGANENSEMSIPAQAFTEAWDSIRAIKK